MSGIAGVILAGGRSSRMGGGDKALLDLGGKPVVAHVIDRLAPQVAQLAINANGDPARFSASGLPVIADATRDFAGPLAGILAGMDWAAQAGFSRIVTAAGDTPFLPADLVALLDAAGAEGIALASSGGVQHPTFGLWPVTLREELRRFLADGGRRVTEFADRHNAASADFPMAEIGGRTIDPFLNLNTLDDLAGARALVAKRTPVFGITGWKNAGKTTLTERLVAELTRRGYRISTVKHAHHAFDIDHPGTDSFRHREAGAREVAIVSSNRWALVHELRGEDEPPLSAILARLEACDLVLVEGYKRDAHAKIEVRRIEAKDRAPLAPGDPTIKAIAADHAVEEAGLPVFALDDVTGIADFVERVSGLSLA